MYVRIVIVQQPEMTNSASREQLKYAMNYVPSIILIKFYLIKWSNATDFRSPYSQSFLRYKKRPYDIHPHSSICNRLGKRESF